MLFSIYADCPGRVLQCTNKTKTVIISERYTTFSTMAEVIPYLPSYIYVSKRRKTTITDLGNVLTGYHKFKVNVKFLK